MAKRDDLTLERVEQICNEMTGHGLKPTVRLIRGRIGGSNTTILNHLRTWEQRNAPVKRAIEIPPELLATLLSHMERAASAAQSQSQMRAVELLETVEDIASENFALQDQIAELTSQCAALSSLRDALMRIPLIADTHSRLIADSVPGDRGHLGWGA